MQFFVNAKSTGFWAIHLNQEVFKTLIFYLHTIFHLIET